MSFRLATSRVCFAPATSDRAILILHGLFGSSRNWRRISEVLSARCQRPVYAADLRNHGQTFIGHGAQEMNWPLLCGDLQETITAIPESNVTLMGHSLGGQVIMQTGFRNALPKTVEKLVIIDVAPKPIQFADSQTEKLLDKMILIQNGIVPSRADAGKILGEIEPNNNVVQFLLSSGSLNREANSFKFNLPLVQLKTGMLRLQSTYEEDIKGKMINKTTLFIKGELSEFIRIPEDTTLIKNRFSSSSLIGIANSGHWPHYDAPEAFTDAVYDFESNLSISRK